MIVKTSAIVLKRFPFGETSIIARCFTREEGKVNIIIKGAKRKKNHSSSFFQPINCLDMLYYFKPNRDIQTASKVSYNKIWSKFHANLKHMSYGMALMEITDKTITNHDPHPELFDELFSVINKIDSQDDKLNIIFWYYEMRLLTLLGYQPNLNDDNQINFNLLNSQKSKNSLKILKTLQTHSLESIPDFNITKEDRNTVGTFLSENLRNHFDYSGPLHSFNFMKKIKF